MKVSITKSKLDNLANAISVKSGEAIPLTIDEMTAAVNSISGGGVPDLQTKAVTYTPSTSQQTATITADAGYDGLSQVGVTVNAIQTETATVTPSASQQTITPTAGSYLSQVTVNATSLQDDKQVSISSSGGTTFYPDAGYLGISQGEVWVPYGYDEIKSSPNSGINAGTIYPSTQTRYLNVTEGYLAEQYREIGAMQVLQLDTSTVSYVPQGQVVAAITPSASVQYLRILQGYNKTPCYYTISAMPSGTEGTPSATKGTVSSNSVTVTPSVTNSAGYIAGGTHTGTGVTVSASELVSGTYNVTSSGTKDVTNYASASVPSGTVTAPSTISGSSATVSTGTNTLTLSKTVSVTPSVTTAGYVSSGTAGNSSVSLTASVTTKGATTYTPTTSDQTISSGTYLTGAQTISGDANLVAGNIKSGTTIFGVTGNYSGGSATIKSATASTSSNATSISFTGVSASPKMFVCMLDAQSSLGSTRYVIAVDYDGTTTRGTYGYSSSNTRYAYYSNSYFTWSYSGTTLTISTNSSTNGGYFRSGYTYRLIYAY